MKYIGLALALILCSCASTSTMSVRNFRTEAKGLKTGLISEKVALDPYEAEIVFKGSGKGTVEFDKEGNIDKCTIVSGGEESGIVKDIRHVGKGALAIATAKESTK